MDVDGRGGHDYGGPPTPATVTISAVALGQVLYNTLAFGIGGVLLGLDTYILTGAWRGGVEGREQMAAERRNTDGDTERGSDGDGVDRTAGDDSNAD